MQIHHLRNATLILTLGERRLLVDPMLAAPAALPGFKLLGGGRRRNPLVALPATAEAALLQVTDVLITHEHPDHFDPAGIEWTRARGLPVWASSIDVRRSLVGAMRVATRALTRPWRPPKWYCTADLLRCPAASWTACTVRAARPRSAARRSAASIMRPAASFMTVG